MLDPAEYVKALVKENWDRLLHIVALNINFVLHIMKIVLYSS